MDYKEVKILLDSYFDGTSSLEDEKRLRHYFEQEKNIPADLEYARKLFVHFTEEAKIEFDGELHYPQQNKRLFYWKIAGIAASLLVLLGVGYMTFQPQDENVYAIINGQPITDKAQAIEETKRALQLMSTNLNQGTRDLEHLSKLNEVKELISKEQ